MTKLSEVPLSELRSDEDWLTSKIGTKGRIDGINAARDGNRFTITLHVVWHNGKESFPEWPRECDNITVDDSYQHIICKPYSDHHIDTLNSNVEYLKRFTAEK